MEELGRKIKKNDKFYRIITTMLNLSIISVVHVDYKDEESICRDLYRLYYKLHLISKMYDIDDIKDLIKEIPNKKILNVINTFIYISRIINMNYHIKTCFTKRQSFIDFIERLEYVINND